MSLGYDVAAPARVPRQRHAGHRDQRPSRQLRERTARRSGRTARAHHPRRAAAGDHHLPGRAATSTRTPTTSGCTRSPGPAFDARRRPRRVSGARRRRGSRRSSTTSAWSIARVKALHAGVPRAWRGEPVRVVVRTRLRRRSHGRLHDAHRRRRLPAQAARGAARAPHAGRPRGLLDAPPRRRRPRGLPVGGVHARPLAGRHRRCADGEFEDDLFAGIRTAAHDRV